MKHYYVWNIINVPNKPDYYKVTSPFNAMQVIEKMADEQLEDDSIDSNAFGLLVGEGDNLPHPSADREMLHWEEWENKDGEDIDAAAESGVWEEE